MNREDTKKAIEVMQAFVDGKEIHKETVAASPYWDWKDSAKTYHIKIKPREFWIWQDPEDFWRVRTTKNPDPILPEIKVREVL